MKRDLKKVFSFMLVLALVIGLLPVPPAFAVHPGVEVNTADVHNASSAALRLTDGGIWTDKEVAILNKDEGLFEVKLKAIGQNFTDSSLSPKLDVVLVLDVSISMRGDKINHLKQAASSATAIFLADGSDNRVGIVKYATMGANVSGLREKGQTQTLLNLIQNNVSVPQNTNDGYTNIQNGIYLAQKMIKNREDKSRTPIIILMSDGEPNRYYESVTNDEDSLKSTGTNANETSVKWTIDQGLAAKEQGIDIYTIGFAVNTEAGTKTLNPSGESKYQVDYIAADGNLTSLQNAFVKLATNLTEFRPTQEVTSGSIYGDIIIQDVIGEGFELIDPLPDGVTTGGSVENVTLTWVISGNSLKTRAAGTTTASIAETEMSLITFKVKLKDSVMDTSKVLYTNSRAEGDNNAAFTVDKKNPAYKGEEAISQLLLNYGWLQLIGYKSLSVEKVVSGSALFADEDFSFKIETKVSGSYVPYEGGYTLSEEGKAPIGARTDPDGMFSLKDGQKATFTSLTDGTEYRIKEVVDGAFTAKGFLNPVWNVGEGTATLSEGYVVGTLDLEAEEGTYSYVCINEVLTADIFFNKIDAELGIPVSAAGFTLTGGLFPAEGITAYSDEYGAVSFKGIPVGRYVIAETWAPKGYQPHTATYQALVTLNNGSLEVSFPEVPGEESDGVLNVLNEPILNQLRIEKIVKGGNAPENQEPAVEMTYDFQITFEKDYWLTPKDFDLVTGSGIAYFKALVPEVPDSLRVVDPLQAKSYAFGLVKDGWITIPVREGVHFTLTEEAGAYVTTYIWQGEEACMEASELQAVMGNKEDSNVITVQNHWGNDGLTVQKRVTGNQAPSDNPSYKFSATFWVAEDKETMEGELIKGPQDEVNTAQDKVDALWNGEDTGLDESQKVAWEDVQNQISLGAIALEDAIATKSSIETDLNEKKDELEALTASIGAINAEIDRLERLSGEDEEYGTRDGRIAELEGELNSLPNQEALQTVIDELEEKLDEAEEGVTEAQGVLERAKDDLEELLESDIQIKAYADALEALKAAENKLDALSDNKEEHFLEKIWNRIKGFFRGLTVGAKGSEEQPAEPSDVYYSSEDEGVTLEYDPETTTGTFWLKDGEEIVFNFDEYFAEHGDETIYFEIAEIDKNGAKAVEMNILGLTDTETSGTAITGKITVNTMEAVNPIITYTNDFGNTTPPGPGNPNPPGPGEKDDVPKTTVPNQPTPAGPAPDGVNILLEEEALPAGSLPKTGGTPALLLYGLGALLAGGGFALRRKENKEK